MSDSRGSILWVDDEIEHLKPHILFLKEGSTMESGPISEKLNSKNLSKCFGIDLDIREFNGRWSAQSTIG